MSMTENELRINGKSFDETISQLEEFMESDDVHGELFTVLRSARDFMENMNEEIQQYRAIGTVEELQKLKGVITDFPLDCGDTVTTVKEILHQLSKYLKIGTIEEFKALKEKAEPKKPIDKIMYLECPACGDVGILDCGYCSVCGQKLDWSEE